MYHEVLIAGSRCSRGRRGLVALVSLFCQARRIWYLPKIITRQPRASTSSHTRSLAAQLGVPIPCRNITFFPSSGPNSYTRMTPYGVSTQRPPGYRSGGYGNLEISSSVMDSRSTRGDEILLGRAAAGERNMR